MEDSVEEVGAGTGEGEGPGPGAAAVAPLPGSAAVSGSDGTFLGPWASHIQRPAMAAISGTNAATFKSHLRQLSDFFDIGSETIVHLIMSRPMSSDGHPVDPSAGLATDMSPSDSDDVGGDVQQLRVVFGQASARAVPLGTGRLEIGREARGATALVIDANDVSRLHAVIEELPERRGWLITDQGSRNGTFVDGVRVDHAELKPGAVIRIGSVLMVYTDAPILPQRLPTRTSGPERICGTSPALRHLRSEIELVGPELVPVLITGESGAGKEQVSEEIHRTSGRSGAFVPVNCAALPAALAESELFGHAAGAFTGAARRNEGLFRAAERGTIFLDEIGEMPLELQPKLLRVLAAGEVRAVGTTDTARLDVRVVAATNRDLAEEVRAGRFRGDLLARLAGWRLDVPPLRARREDIMPLIALFLSRTATAPRLSAGAVEALLVHDWPYNVRELEQAPRAAAVRAGVTRTLKSEHLPPEIGRRVQGRTTVPPPFGLPDRAAPPEAPVANEVPAVPPTGTPTAPQLAKVMERYDGNVARVARFYGKDRRQIYRWLERFGMVTASAAAADDADPAKADDKPDDASD